MNAMALIKEAEEKLAPIFAEMNEISKRRTEDVISAFREHKMTEACLYPTTGYGYDDRGRETIDSVYAEVFGCERAVVRHSIANGTHALTVGLFALLRPGDTMLSVTGGVYDTLEETIGVRGEGGKGTLRDFGIKYSEIPLSNEGNIDTDELTSRLLTDKSIKVVYAQRSRGYGVRRALTSAELSRVYEVVHEFDGVYFVVDNCYGEFTEETEPRADLLIGSLIKNPGGGLALSGGYLAGSKKAVELASYRLTTPGLGDEVGATLGQNRNIIQGFFMAPHAVCQAKMTAALAAYVFEAVGYEVSPRWDEGRSDIIETIRLGSPEALCAFCRGIQYG